MRVIVNELVSPDGKRKVEIFRRADGSFGFESFRFSDEPLENCWIPENRRPVCVAATQEIAEREARERVKWLSDPGDGG